MSQAVAQKETSSPFYNDLGKLIRREDLVQFFRLTSKGVFIDEKAFEILFAAYQKWQHKVRPDAEVLSGEKVRKRLLGVDPLPLQYLLEGKKCFLGYLLPNSIPTEGNGGGLASTGTLFDPLVYLDARDPIFTQVENVRLINSPVDGILIHIQTKRGHFDCTTEVIKKFALCCRQSQQLSKEFPEAVGNLRDCLLPLKHVLNRARPVPSEIPCLVPVDYQGREYSLFQYRNLLIFLKEHRVVGFFERKGRGENAFLREEIARVISLAEKEEAAAEAAYQADSHRGDRRHNDRRSADPRQQNSMGPDQRRGNARSNDPRQTRSPGDQGRRDPRGNNPRQQNSRQQDSRRQEPRGKQQQNPLRGFSPLPEKHFALGKIWYRGMSFLLHPNAFKQFLRLSAVHQKQGKKKSGQGLPTRFTVKHALADLLQAFFRSQPLSEEITRKFPLRYRIAAAKYRRYSEFVFVITDKNTLSNCFPIRNTREHTERKGSRGQKSQAFKNPPEVPVPRTPVEASSAQQEGPTPQTNLSTNAELEVK